ncbi:MAG: hypothetical protein MZU97_12705 [Bacillus subtilis]|nr:hypothetical protein [Bacillus subtilis]
MTKGSVEYGKDMPPWRDLIEDSNAGERARGAAARGSTATATILLSERKAKELGLVDPITCYVSYAFRPPYVRNHFFYQGDPDHAAYDIAEQPAIMQAAKEVYRLANVTKDDIDVVQVRDLSGFEGIMSLEALGLDPDRRRRTLRDVWRRDPQGPLPDLHLRRRHRLRPHLARLRLPDRLHRELPAASWRSRRTPSQGRQGRRLPGVRHALQLRRRLRRQGRGDLRWDSIICTAAPFRRSKSWRHGRILQGEGRPLPPPVASSATTAANSGSRAGSSARNASRRT